jgi:hypothetical protein
MGDWKVVFAGGERFSQKWISQGVGKKIIEETDSPSEVRVDDDDLAILLTRLGSKIRVVGIDVREKRVTLPVPVPESSSMVCPACHGIGRVPVAMASVSRMGDSAAKEWG